MGWYSNWVHDSPLIAAFVQFAILGSLGELLGIAAAKRSPSRNPLEWLAKAVVWGGLGILVKYAFTGYNGFLQALVARGFLPAICLESLVIKAFCMSVITNAQFGPLLMGLHRTTDNIITGSHGYAGIGTSLATLAWFWVPAHTITFSLPAELQVGLAALWSVALGVIMGFTKRSTNA